jgi:hypothetical protein
VAAAGCWATRWATRWRVFGSDDLLRPSRWVPLNWRGIASGSVGISGNREETHEWGDIAILAKIPTCKDCTKAEYMSSSMIKGVSIGLSRNWFAALDGLNVVVGGSQIHERDDHTMEIAYHMVENMGQGHVETGPVLPLG